MRFGCGFGRFVAYAYRDGAYAATFKSQIREKRRNKFANACRQSGARNLSRPRSSFPISMASIHFSFPSLCVAHRYWRCRWCVVCVLCFHRFAFAEIYPNRIYGIEYLVRRIRMSVACRCVPSNSPLCDAFYVRDGAPSSQHAI